LWILLALNEPFHNTLFPKKMKPDTIIWDFDGTLLPSDPYDSEQTLLRYRLSAKEETISIFRRMVAMVIIYADRKEWLKASFKKYYLWLLKGTPVEWLNRVAVNLAKKITTADRSVYRDLCGKGHTMIVLSCGTFDLIERTIQLADLQNCFTVIKGNQFELDHHRISGMVFRILTPQDKLEQIRSIDIPLESTMAVGDGYTDLPLLDRVGIPVMMDRTGLKIKRYAHKGYRFISTAAEILDIVQK
jgi:phosphoserine phosphatase